jgi:hypothetical protein
VGLDNLEWQMVKRYGHDALFLEALQTQAGGLRSFLERRPGVFRVVVDAESGKPVVGMALVNHRVGAAQRTSRRRPQPLPKIAVSPAAMALLTSDRFGQHQVWPHGQRDGSLQKLVESLLGVHGVNNSMQMQKLRAMLKTCMGCQRTVKRSPLRAFLRKYNQFEARNNRAVLLRKTHGQ